MNPNPPPPGSCTPDDHRLHRRLFGIVRPGELAPRPASTGQRAFLLAILIGIFEATSIDRRVKGIQTPRPLTHDLLVNSVESLGGEFQDVVISELREHTYFAKLRVRHDGELIEIDARPSDAIAVAVTCDPPLPIYVAEDVLNDVMGEQQ